MLGNYGAIKIALQSGAARAAGHVVLTLDF